jgi:membrane protease subunit (stomatin/prohibitin family)
MEVHEFRTTQDIINAHKGHYFDADTMRFFKSRVLWQVFPGKDEVYFVTSERNTGILSGTNYPRKYTVRAYNPETDNIRTVPPFNELSKYKALRIARDLAETVGVA